MPRIIIAGASEGSRTQLNRLLTSSGYAVFRLCASGGELRRTLAECGDGIVLIAGALPDGLPGEIAADFDDGFRFLLIARADALDACESPRVFKLTYPCPGSAVTGAIEMLSQLHHMRMPRREGEDKAIVDEAKALMMREHGIDEPEAHRRMQLFAMHHSIKMTDYAAMLLQGSEGTEE